ncbi:MAG: ABC transporter ATP-binding protein [Anaerolineae bacterium]|nr:ABC transporter ATP-binding protein [Anaerolineae bacterium]
MTVLLKVNDLARRFKHGNGDFIDAVKGISFTIEEGEIFSLLGPNGAGKSTTISMISGLIEPTRGDALIGGHSIVREPLKAKSLLGIVPQEVALYPKLSARQNLDFFGRMYGMGGKALSVRIDEVLDIIDLADRQKDLIETFSGGMKRRVNIGAGLLHKPKLVYMDEPTVGVDPQSRRRILDTVFRLRDEYSMTVLYTTHQMEEAQELSDRVGIIDHGEIIAMGTVGELIQKVGEEDRLEFCVGEQKVDGLLKQFETQVEGVTKALYDAREQEGTAMIDGVITIYAKRGRKALPDLLRITNDAGLDVVSVTVHEPDLEAVFLLLTGRDLRE